MSYVYSTIDIYDSLMFKYKEYLKPEIISILIIQSEEEVLLESMETEIIRGGLEKQTISRINLELITDAEDEDKLFFDPKDPIENNAIKFIEEFTPYSIVNATDLFHIKACEKINNKYNTFGIDK